MRLSPFATEADVDEALRLFQVSTLDAAMSGSLAGIITITYAMSRRFQCTGWLVFAKYEDKIY